MANVYEIVGEKIVAMLNNGIIPWDRPWTGTGYAWSRSTGKGYSLLNQILLEEPGEYVTFSQVKREGGKVKKGAKSKFVVFWKLDKKVKEDEETGEDLIQIRPILRYYHVFNVKDTTLEQKFNRAKDRVEFDEDEGIETVINAYLNKYHIQLCHQEQNRAYYSPVNDAIVLPLKKQFKSIDGYYSVKLHELTHSTGHKSRLSRITTDEVAAHGEEYAKEELVAEFGSAALCHIFGYEKMIENNASYIQGWSTAIKEDPRMFVNACAQADKAIAMILQIA